MSAKYSWNTSVSWDHKWTSIFATHCWLLDDEKTSVALLEGEAWIGWKPHKPQLNKNATKTMTTATGASMQRIMSETDSKMVNVISRHCPPIMTQFLTEFDAISVFSRHQLELIKIRIWHLINFLVILKKTGWLFFGLLIIIICMVVRVSWCV